MSDPFSQIGAPDSKLSRQAELDALREKQIANSNAKALEDTGNLPLNMMDWQAQQRAMKEADRQSKNQSAAMLRNYKGTAEQSALKAMRDEDREKQRMAQQQLHNYRARFHGGGAKGDDPGAQAQVDGVEQQEDILSGISVPGAVAALNKPPEQEDVIHATPYSRGHSAAIEGLDSSPQSQTEGMVVVEKPDETLADSMVLVSENEEIQPTEEWINVPPAGQQPLDDEWGNMTMKHSNIANPLDESEGNPVEASVDFSFALLTLSQQPDLDKYLRAATFIVGESKTTGPALVKATETKVADRPGVFRCEVTVNMPIRLDYGANYNEARQHVLGVLKSAMQDGTLKSVALSS